jgi:hypothetical protein
VSADDLAPVNADLGAVDLGLGLVHVCDSLADVERSIGLFLHILNVKKGGILALVVKGSLESENLAVAVETVKNKCR